MSEHNRAITILEKELERLVQSAKENRRVEFERRTWAENQEKEAGPSTSSPAQGDRQVIQRLAEQGCVAEGQSHTLGGQPITHLIEMKRAGSNSVRPMARLSKGCCHWMISKTHRSPW